MIIPGILVEKLIIIGSPPSNCAWIWDFLSNCPQGVKTGAACSCTLCLLAWTPSKAMCRALSCTLMIVHLPNTISKSFNDTPVTDLMSRGDKTAYKEVVKSWHFGVLNTNFCSTALKLRRW